MALGALAVTGVAVTVLLFAVLGPAHEFGAKSAGPGAPVALTVDDLPAPVGLGLSDISFGWHVTDSRRGAVQSAYRVVVSRPVLGGPQPRRRADHLGQWQSPRRRSRRSSRTADPPLRPTRPTGGRSKPGTGRESAGPSRPAATFDTGLRDADWHADWIKRPTTEVLDTPATFNTQNNTGVWAYKDEYSYVRKEATLGRSPIVRARAYVSADQQYELYVNGTMAAKGEAYAFPDSQYYETTDITRLLRAGRDNAFGIIYNWQGPGKGRPEGTPGVIARISVLHADGTVEVITTDGTWRVLPGAWLPGVQRDEEGDPVDYTENINGAGRADRLGRTGLRALGLAAGDGDRSSPNRTVDSSGVGADPHRVRTGRRGLRVPACIGRRSWPTSGRSMPRSRR